MKPSTAGRTHAAPSIDILVHSPLWQAEAEAVVRSAVIAAAAALATKNIELAVVLADDEAVRALNRDWRGIDAPTNVLSFPVKQPPAAGTLALLGDIVIAHETVASEAAAQGIPFLHHLAHLAVHGFLHLMDYDHENDRDARAMERLEQAILARLDVPDPYLARDPGAL